MITVQGREFKTVQELIGELLITRSDVVWDNTFRPALQELDEADTVMTDYEELLQHLRTYAAKAPANQVYDLPLEMLELFTRPAARFAKSAGRGFKQKAEAPSALEPRRVLVRNLVTELEGANKVRGMTLHFGALRKDDPVHIGVLNQINNLTARTIQFVLYNWNDSEGGGAALMTALGEVGFVQALYEWVTGTINCNMQAGAKLRGACDKVQCTLRS
ncbi:hypothetical protein [Nonomuraea sp. NPDC050786]|uniref:hypothetical protein n=1 Tax=Nonomuraea sp. NPDC050786 TaxID=3154840 RepID=UPI0033EFC3BF